MSKTSSVRPQWMAMGLLTGAHLFHDMSLGYLGILLPLLREEMGFSLFLAGLLLPAQQFGSLLQPYFGNKADTFGRRRFLIFFLLLTPLWMSLIGISRYYIVLFLLIALAGFCSAAYHPAGSSLLTDYAGSRWGTGLAIYHFGGNFGLAVGPLAAGFVAATLGVGWSPILFIPALLWAVIVIKWLPRATEHMSGATRAGSLAYMWLHKGVFGRLGMVVLGRAVGAGALTLFLPSLLVEQGYGFEMVSSLTAGFFLMGGIGGLLSGWLSDRFGRINVMAVLLVSAPISMLGFLFLGRGAGFVLLLVAAMALLGEQPVVMAMVQEWAPSRRGMIVGIVLGAQFVLAGIASVGVGYLADQFSLETAFKVVALAPLIGLPFVFGLPMTRLDPESESVPA